MLTIALRCVGAFPERASMSDRSVSRRALLQATAVGAGALALGESGFVRPAQAVATSHTVAFDKYSLIVDGRRLVLWSGEFHPFRLPSPSLWADVLQKMRANGYNA